MKKAFFSCELLLLFTASSVFAEAGIIYRNPRVYNVEYTFEMFPDPNKVDQDKDLKLWIPIPREWDSQKSVKIVSVEPKPHGRYIDHEHGNPMLFWDFSEDPEKSSYKVNLKFRSEQYDVHSNIDPNRIGSYDNKSKDYILYTRSTSTISITDKVRTLAKNAIGGEKNPYLQAKQIYEFVREKMWYRQPSVQGAMLSVKTILDSPVIDPMTGREHYLGLCGHQSMVFIALCRAVGIPARSVLALWDHYPWIRPTPENPEPRINFLKQSIQGLAVAHRTGLAIHVWAEIYLPNYGWVPVDPTFGKLGCSKVNNRSVIISKGRSIKIDPDAVQKGNGQYREFSGLLHEGRAEYLMMGIFHAPTIQSVKLEHHNHPDPFPADALAEYTAKFYSEREAKKNLHLYRRRLLRWIDRNTREHTDKVAALLQAYKKEPRARYEHQAFVCHMLRKVVGDKKFWDIVETYIDLRVQSGEPVSTTRFQKIAERVYGQPLDWFFKQWVDYTEIPHIQLDAVTYYEDEKGWHVSGTIHQLNKSLFHLPVELVVETEKITEHKTLWLDDRNTGFEFSVDNRPKNVLVDPNNDILCIREMPPLLEGSSHDEIAFCTITYQDRAGWYDWTPLHFAAQAGRTDVVEYFVSAGADINAETISGETPLQIAAGMDHKEVMELLIENGAYVSLHVVARLGDLADAKNLIEKGADVNVKDERRRTPLHIAVAEKHKKVVELLIAKGADINAKNNVGRTPLHCAARSGQRDLVELLVAKGADINARNRWDRTPLDNAVAKGHRNIVEYFISKGADINSKDNSRRTPLHHAVNSGQKDIVELLIAKGADTNVRDDEGRTPLNIAKKQGRTKIAELLRGHGAKE